MEEKKARILVVDDEPEIVNTLKHFLYVKGYEVIGALDGQEALDILEKEKMDLILLDIMMPGMKGTEIAKIIKEKYSAVKVIILTAYPEEGEKLVKDNRLEGIFIKPVRIQELYAKLSEIINLKDTSATQLQCKQGMKARVLLIKAKILFMEPSAEIYQFLKPHFRELSSKGEIFELDTANNEEECIKKIELFEPDIFAANVSFFKQVNPDLLSKIAEKGLSSKEIIVYNLENIKDFHRAELERLTKAVEIACLKNGLIETKWVEI